MTTPVTLIGASKFALEVARYIADVARSGGPAMSVVRFLALEGEEAAAPADATRPFSFDALRGDETALVLACSDPDRRAALIPELWPAMKPRFVDVVHPSSTVAADSLADGGGVILGPHCHIGVNARIGALNVLNYSLTIGHHSRFGDGNFMSPGFHCGNSVAVGDGNFFGLGCLIAPGLTVGNRNRMQAGSILTESIGDGLFCFPSSRTKSMAL